MATHLDALGDDLAVVDDLNRTLVDLGRDVERLEERGLRRVETGGTLRNGDAHRRDDTSLGSSGLDILLDDVLELRELTVGEHEADVANHVREKAFPLGVIAISAHVLDAATDHGVLAEEELTLAAHGDTDVGDLLRADEVNIDQESARVLVEALLKVSEIGDLLAASDHASSRTVVRNCVEPFFGSCACEGKKNTRQISGSEKTQIGRRQEWKLQLSAAE